MVDDDGTKEREKACESGPPNADVVRNVQSSVMPVMDNRKMNDNTK